MTTYTTPADAITRSISHNERAAYAGSLADLIAYAAAQGYQTDHARENDGSIDVWGWTNDTPEHASDWRILVVARA